MDHLRKALEKADASSTTVRDWMQPVGNAVRDTQPSRVEVKPTQVIHPDSDIAGNPHLIGFSNKNTVILDRYRLLRTRMQQAMKKNNWSIVSVTSSTPEAGKTLTTLNLGLTFAMTETQKVIVLDADLRKPSTAAMLGLSPEKGLVDYLNGTADLHDVLFQPSGYGGISIIPAAGKNQAKNPSELLKSSRFDTLMKTLRTSGAIILVDTPPLQVGDDVLTISQHTDCLLLIIEEGKTTSQDLKDAKRLLSNHNLIGTVLNKSEAQPKRFQSYYASSETQN
ncbi:MAG: CpsD/CapB family tyrosine-protein kinase [Pseudomonadales bacterium]|nr:CpsD/CapB family tyrosine-protein kinase [Pseudomonadales bacterium]MCP5185878.1 CpsD/CapB family tyrosine-protein kinase [Pseudomonadales bacterium]